MRSLYLLPFALLMAGCVTQPPPLSRDEYLSMSQRAYDAPPEAVFAAAEKLFKLSDESDYSFAYPDPKTMIATRKFFWYAVIAASRGTDSWRLTVEPKGTGSLARMEVASTSIDNNVALIYGVGAVPYTTGGLPGAPNDSKGLYGLFWARLDHLLGKRPDWISCAQAPAFIKASGFQGRDTLYEPLCGLMQDDKSPEGAAAPAPK